MQLVPLKKKIGKLEIIGKIETIQVPSPLRSLTTFKRSLTTFKKGDRKSKRCAVTQPFVKNCQLKLELITPKVY